MTINHIDQLTEWWENAEQGTPREGDRLIINEGDGDYAFEQATPGAHEEVDSVRIMSRAPKPKPAWHDAPAVIASHVDSAHRSTWTPDPIVPGMWFTDDDQRDAEDLRDVTPLIEAKVTDETARTVLDRYYETETGHDWPEDTIALMRLAVTAALGLESV